MDEAEKRTIFDYRDFRAWLGDTLAERRATSRAFSLRAFAGRVGCDPGFLSRIISGERVLTPELALKIGSELDLSPREVGWFETMVGFTQAKTDIEREHFHSRMRTATGSRIRRVKSSQYGLYGSWHTAVARELINALPCPDSNDAAAEILEKHIVPHVKQSDLKRSIEILREQGLIERTAHRKLAVVDKVITTGPEIPPEAVREILSQLFELGIESLDRFAREERACASVTLSVSQSGYEQIKAKLDECRREILEIARTDRKRLDRIYQCNMQLFPVSKHINGESP